MIVENLFQKILRYLSVSQAVVLGFIVVMFGGGVILWAITPDIRLLDGVFTSVSAVGVTGLIVLDTAILPLRSQIWIMILIEIGGLGIVGAFSMIWLLILRGQSSASSSFFGFLKEGWGATSVKSLTWMIISIFVIVQGVGFLFLWWGFAHHPQLLDGHNPAWLAIFHSISAFCNAGFSLFPDNLCRFKFMPEVWGPVGALIVIGGIGFRVLVYLLVVGYLSFQTRTMLLNKEHNFLNNLSELIPTTLQFKISIYGTIFLLILGAVVPGIIEWDNPTFAGITFWQHCQIWIFGSITPRTAGFNTIDYSVLSQATLFVYGLLMAVGACPGGTAGGMKITTVFIGLAYLRDMFVRPGQPIRVFGCQLSRWSVSPAMRLIVFCLLIYFPVSLFCLLITDSKHPALNLWFEEMSAWGTVGLSVGYKGTVTSLSAQFSDLGKLNMIITMFVGRVGPLLIIAALRSKNYVSVDRSEPEVVLDYKKRPWPVKAVEI